MAPNIPSSVPFPVARAVSGASVRVIRREIRACCCSVVFEALGLEVIGSARSETPTILNPVPSSSKKVTFLVNATAVESWLKTRAIQVLIVSFIFVGQTVDT